MGMLTLAGVVSGGGKALQQGLQNTQQYMTYSMLQKERDEMERARMDITYGRELGILQKRQDFDRESADLAHSRALDREEQRQDFESGESRKTRAAQRDNAELQSQREMDKEDRQQQRSVTNKVLDMSYEQQKDAREEKQSRAKEARARIADDRKFQQEAGLRLTEKTMDMQRQNGGSASANPELNNQFKVITDEIKGLEHMIANEFDTDTRKKLQKQLDAKLAERRSLANLPSSQQARPQYRFPE